MDYFFPVSLSWRSTQHIHIWHLDRINVMFIVAKCLEESNTLKSDVGKVYTRGQYCCMQWEQIIWRKKYSNESKSMAFVWHDVQTTLIFQRLSINAIYNITMSLHVFIFSLKWTGPCLQSEVWWSVRSFLRWCWPGSCTPRWRAATRRTLRSSRPPACPSVTPGRGRSWRRGSTAPCTEESQLAYLQQHPLAVTAWETRVHGLPRDSL